jgi:hypothetical protein
LRETHRWPTCWLHKGISHERDIWGHDVEHHWSWWRRQLAHHLARSLSRHPELDIRPAGRGIIPQRAQLTEAKVEEVSAHNVVTKKLGHAPGRRGRLA